MGPFTFTSNNSKVTNAHIRGSAKSSTNKTIDDNQVVTLLAEPRILLFLKLTSLIRSTIMHRYDMLKIDRHETRHVQRAISPQVSY